jgi:hypothetical protein
MKKQFNTQRLMVSHLKISASKKQRTDDDINKTKNAVVSKFVWKWATHLDKGFQLLQTNFGDLKHEQDIRRHQSSIEKWHSCKCYVTKQRSVTDTNCNKLKYNVNGNSLTSVLPECPNVTHVKQTVTFSKTVHKIILDLRYNDSSQLKWISQCIHKVHTLWLSI